MVFRLQLSVVGIFLTCLVGCAPAMKTTVPVPVVSNSEALLKMEQAKKAEEPGANGEKLKNMSVGEHLQQGNAALGRNDLALAKLHFTLAIAKDQTLTEAYLGLGNALISEGKYLEGKTVLQNALSNGVEDFRISGTLGVICRVLGDQENALALLIEANRQSPENSWLMTELAITYENSGQFKEAEKQFTSVLRLMPGSSEAHNNLGFNYILQGRYFDAISVLEKASRLSPENKIVINNLALARALYGEPERSLQLFEKSVGKAGAFNNLGYILMVQKKNREAEQALSRALEEKPVFYARAKENLELLKSNEDQQSRLLE